MENPNILYCVFDPIVTLENSVCDCTKSSTLSCITFDTDNKLKSPTFSVPDIVLKPSCARKTISPPTSCTVSPSTHPISLAMGLS